MCDVCENEIYTTLKQHKEKKQCPKAAKCDQCDFAARTKILVNKHKGEEHKK